MAYHTVSFLPQPHGFLFRVWLDTLSIILLAGFLAGCQVQTIGELHTGAGATGDPVIYIKDGFYNGQFREIPDKIFFYQDANPFSSEEDIQTAITLEARGGTVNSGQAEAYHWELVENGEAPDWFNLRRNAGQTQLQAYEDGGLNPPDETTVFQAGLRVTTDEGKQAEAFFKVVVLANHGKDNNAAWQSSGFQTDEEEDELGGNFNANTNPTGRKFSNDCTSEGQRFEWLNRGDTVRSGRLLNGEVDCLRIRVVETNIIQAFYIEEIPYFEPSPDLDCATDTETDREYSFLIYAGYYPGDDFCGTNAGFVYNLNENDVPNFIPDNPKAASPRPEKMYPQLEQDGPFVLTRVFNENPASFHIQYERFRKNDNSWHCDPPPGALEKGAACARLEQVSRTPLRWKLSFLFSEDKSIRDPTDSANDYPYTEGIKAGQGDYYLIMRNNSPDAVPESGGSGIPDGVLNYRVWWPAY